MDFRGTTLQRVVADRSSWSSTRSCLPYENSRKNGERFEENLRESRKRRLDDSRGTPVVVGQMLTVQSSRPGTMGRQNARRE